MARFTSEVPRIHPVVRINAWADAKRSAASNDVAEFDRIHSEQQANTALL